MSEREHQDATVDLSRAGDAFDQGLAAAFGPDSGPAVPPSVLQALGAALPVPHVNLRDPESGATAPLRPSSEETPQPALPSGAKLQLLGEIARGGMGAVLKGRDVDLGRDVAVKVLLETHQGRVELAQRFLEEAQIHGQLQHPGIAPVYELGALPDRRPYFTMKLVQGHTLAALLHQRQQISADRPRFLAVFLQVCQTLAYAHARGSARSPPAGAGRSRRRCGSRPSRRGTECVRAVRG
jgi:hypothetical protein